jgi:hypothetical protein
MKIAAAGVKKQLLRMILKYIQEIFRHFFHHKNGKKPHIATRKAQHKNAAKPLSTKAWRRFFTYGR